MTLTLNKGRVLIAALLVGACGALISGCSSETEAQAVKDSAKAAKLENCVRPKDFMRRNHMELIRHQRDITVHEGIRETKNSLAACIACHVQYDNSGQPIPVDAKGQFCNSCHYKLAVQPDCFQCHSTVPVGPDPSNLARSFPEVFGSGSDANVAPNVAPTGDKPPSAAMKETPKVEPTANAVPTQPLPLGVNVGFFSTSSWMNDLA